MLGDTGFEPHGGPSRNVEAVTVGGVAVEVQRGVGLRQMHMAADLHRTVAGVHDVHGQTLGAGIEGDVALSVHDLARDHHGIGWWTVTSLVPSGNVASTWTS
jgi:hypothetical protein